MAKADLRYIRNASGGVLNAGGAIIMTKLPEQDAIRYFESVSQRDVVEITLFEHRLGNRYHKTGGEGTITQCYFNPVNRTVFIGFEGTKFRFLPKDVPLPAGWKVVIRNIWDEKKAYEYPTGASYVLNSKEYDALEEPLVFSRFEWSVAHRVNSVTIMREIYAIMEENGELPRGYTKSFLDIMEKPVQVKEEKQ